MSRRIYTKENMGNIIKLYDSGTSGWSIASMFGISKSTVYNYLRENNIKLRIGRFQNRHKTNIGKHPMFTEEHCKKISESKKGKSYWTDKMRKCKSLQMKGEGNSW